MLYVRYVGLHICLRTLQIYTDTSNIQHFSGDQPHCPTESRTLCNFDVRQCHNIGEVCLIHLFSIKTCELQYLETLKPHSFLNNSTNIHRRPLKPFVMCFSSIVHEKHICAIMLNQARSRLIKSAQPLGRKHF